MKKYFINFSIVILIATLITSIEIPYAQAVQNTFETALGVISDDFTAPSVPTGLAATPYSSTQINLAWNASTDNVAVTGYRIFRDTLVIATTTSLFYQNTGLTASTTYDYNVEAFDAALNYSGQSSTESTTTLQTPVPSVSTTTTSGGGSGGGSIILSIYNNKATPSLDSAIVDFTTNQPVQAKVYWGLTPDHELGAISGLFYAYDHSVKIENLEQNTQYFYKIEVVNSLGIVKSIESSFKTLGQSEVSVLTNVSNFKAIPNSQPSIELSWNNPQNINFDSVRIIRSDKFFPRDINDGVIVYEGSGQTFTDRDVSIGTTYYYSIFAKDTEGNYSSGVLAQARIKPAGEIVIVPTSTDPFININVLKNVDPTIAQLSLLDFDFIQSGRKLLNIGNNVTIDGTKNLTVSLDYHKVPEILKTIAVTLIDPEDPTQVFPFLLRINKDKTAYEATLAPLGKSGKYGMKIIILDYKNQGLKRLEGSLQAFIFEGAKEFLKNKIGLGNNYLILLLIILILIIIYLIKIHLRRRKDMSMGEYERS